MCHVPSSGGEQLRVLVVEDGEEYTMNLSRFLSDLGFSFHRAGCGAVALEMLHEGFDVIFLDMCFDRIPPDALLGDVVALTDRFSGDRERAVRFLVEHQGAFILAAIRGEGFRVPVLLSHDFSGEPRRFANLEGRHAPLSYILDNAGPQEVRAALQACAGLRGA